MQCILTEKPSQAKNYAKALGGYSGIFNNKEYIIVNSVGHIFEYYQPENNVKNDFKDEYKKWNLENLPWNKDVFLWKKQLMNDKKDVYFKIRDAMSKADEIVIATDDDPSGEGTLLADEIILSLNLKNKRYYRCFHIDESEKEIRKAMCCLTDLGYDVTNDSDYQKAIFRAKWDYLSMQWTRLFSIYAKTLLRQGRLKSFIVWLVGEQIRLIKEYKKIPFYENRFKDDNGVIYSDEEAQKYSNPNDVVNDLKGSNVIKDEETIKHKAPPTLYNLNMLASVLAPKGYSAKKVLETYQKMYDDNVVSYPRTEDKKITPEQFNDFLQIAISLAKLYKIDTSLFKHLQPRSTHVAAGGSHGANRPSSNVPNSLEELKEKYGDCGLEIYEVLVKNSLAMLCEDYEYLQQKGHLLEYPTYKGIANIPLKKGYKAVFNDDEDELVATCNNLNKGLGNFANPFVYEGFPKKPDSPTAKWLAKQLEKNDVGTGATRTSIYAEISDSKSTNPLLNDYKGKISLADSGEKSYILLKNTHIADVNLTKQVQQQMKDVAKDYKKADYYLQQIESLINDDKKIVENNSKNLSAKSTDSFKKVVIGKCPKCNSIVVECKTKAGIVYKCEKNTKDNPQCDFALWENTKYFQNNLKINQVKAQKLLNKQKVAFSLISKDGKPYNAYLRLVINGKYVNFENCGFVNKK